jgi:hypothetical protein
MRVVTAWPDGESSHVFSWRNGTDSEDDLLQPLLQVIWTAVGNVIRSFYDQRVRVILAMCVLRV